MIDSISCDRCLKRPELCVCPNIFEQKTNIHVLILQHPQEPDHDLGTGRLTHLALPNSTLKIGLSWRNLAATLDKKEVDPARWAVLYLGSGVKGQINPKEILQFVSDKGIPEGKPKQIEGLVVLDGTWSQAKTLWWRNAWLLKLNRVILIPQNRSLYKEQRREPRRECLSTIESVAEVLIALGEKQEVGKQLQALFGKMLDQYRQVQKS